MTTQQDASAPIACPRPCTMEGVGVLFTSDSVAVCRGGLTPEDPRWETEQINHSPPCVSFPMRPVMVEKEGMTAFVASMNRASFFNHGQFFRVRPVGPRSTESIRFYYHPAVIAEAFDRGPRWTEDPDRPFPVGSALIGHATYLHHRLVHRALQHTPDPVLIEETALRILADAVVAVGERARPTPATSRTRRAHEDAVRAVEACIATRFDERLTVGVIARAACVAPTHLCRIYRAHTGITIHECLTQHRVRHAIRLIMDGGPDTSEIALACGFSSRSHLSDAMKRTVGVRPSDVRAGPGGVRRAFARLGAARGTPAEN